MKQPTCCCVVEETRTEVFTKADPKPEVIVVKKEKRGRGRPRKEVGEFGDQLAAGRKRALREFPIAPGTTCEWAWRKNNGGGIVPVFGCTGRTARHIHHGPDKSVLNNDRSSNISIVCTFCHQLWHARNDKYYEEPRPEDGSAWLPYSERQVIHRLDESERATIEETIEFELSIDREMSVADWERIRNEQSRAIYLASAPVERGQGQQTENES